MEMAPTCIVSYLSTSWTYLIYWCQGHETHLRDFALRFEARLDVDYNWRH